MVIPRQPVDRDVHDVWGDLASFYPFLPENSRAVGAESQFSQPYRQMGKTHTSNISLAPTGDTHAAIPVPACFFDNWLIAHAHVH